jgi:hypothetical protein
MNKRRNLYEVKDKCMKLYVLLFFIIIRSEEKKFVKKKKKDKYTKLYILYIVIYKHY